MKVLSLNFVTCAVKACKSSSDSYPLHPKDAELVEDEIELIPEMIINVLPRLDWAALRTTTSEVSADSKKSDVLKCTRGERCVESMRARCLKSVVKSFANDVIAWLSRVARTASHC